MLATLEGGGGRVAVKEIISGFLKNYFNKEIIFSELLSIIKLLKSPHRWTNTIAQNETVKLNL